MRISVQRKACRKMPQHARYGLDVHSVLQGQRCEGVAQVMESDVLRADGLQNFIVGSPEGVRVIHGGRL